MGGLNMKLIKPSFEIWKQEPGLEGIYKAIEKAGRVCYKSEDKITENSAKPFVNRMLSLHHGSVLEHGTIYLKYEGTFLDPEDIYVKYGHYSIERFYKNPYSKVVIKKQNEDWKANVYIVTNYRVLMQGSYKTWEEASKNNYDKNWLDELHFLCEPTEFHEKRITVHLTCDRGVWNEFIRHRALARTDDINIVDEDAERLFSFSQESQRYCNYSLNKFDNEITFCIPCWMSKLEEGEYSEDFDSIYDCVGTNLFDYDSFLIALAGASKHYMRLLDLGWKPQQARVVLPNACKTELVMTGFVSQWKDFFLLRSNKYGKGGAHPSADELATPLYEEFVARGYITDNK